MKCIKHGDVIKRITDEVAANLDVIKRVTDEVAANLVGMGKASYCSKEEWKKKVRGPVKVNPETEAVKVAIESKKSKKAKKAVEVKEGIK
jgi:hypothetical protein